MRILLFALLLIANVAHAQVKVASSNTFSIANGLVPDQPKVLGYVDGKYYLYNTRTGILVAYDKKMAATAEYKLGIAQEGEYAGCFSLDEKMYVLIASKSDDKGRIVAYEVTKDGKTNEATTLSKSLEEIRTDAKPKINAYKGNGLFEVKQSTDKSRLCFYYSDENMKKETSVFNIVMLDNKFGKLWSKVINLPFNYDKTRGTYIAIDNDGNACAATRYVQDSENSRATYVHLFNNQGSVQKIVHNATKEKMISGIEVLADNRSNFYVATKYHMVYEADRSGLILSLYNVNSNSPIWQKDHDDKKVYTTADRKLGVSSSQFNITSINQATNGSVYITYEQSYSYTSMYGMMFTTFTSEGELLNGTFLPKKHATMFTSWAPVVLKDNKISSIYYFEGDRRANVNPGFYSLSYDGNKVERKYIPDTHVGGSLMESTVIDNNALLVFINDIRTGALHLADF